MPTNLPHATDTLRERILSKIVMPGPATPCATWVGGYNVDGRRTRGHTPKRRPVVRLGGRGTTMVYVAPVLLTLAEGPPDGRVACHRCPTGTPADRTYRCVDLDHLRWGTRAENEADKREG